MQLNRLIWNLRQQVRVLTSLVPPRITKKMMTHGCWCTSNNPSTWEAEVGGPQV
jgi:hypothetical protein